MATRKFSAAIAAILAVMTLSTSGCFWVAELGPNLGFLSFPVPVTPWLQKEKEDRAWEQERYDRVPILGPITSGGPPVALDAPSDDEVMRAWERAHQLEGGFPMLYEKQLNNVRIVKHKIADYVDPPRVYPLIGPAQLHHAHYKCIIYYSLTERVGWPVPYTTVDEDASEVIYVDHNHLHMVGNVNTGVGAEF